MTISYRWPNRGNSHWPSMLRAVSLMANRQVDKPYVHGVASRCTGIAHPGGGAFPRADVDGGVRGVLLNGMGPDGIAV